MQARADGGLHVTGMGKRFEWVKLSGPAAYWQPGADGSGILTLEEGTSLAVDFSQTSGAEAMLVTTGRADGTQVATWGEDAHLQVPIVRNGTGPHGERRSRGRG